MYNRKALPGDKGADSAAASGKRGNDSKGKGEQLEHGQRLYDNIARSQDKMREDLRTNILKIEQKKTQTKPESRKKLLTPRV